MSTGRGKIEVQDASKVFQEGTVVAFRHLDLVVREHETLCIVGPSGCGKTTLLRCIAGLLPLTSGRILIDGEPVHAPRPGVAVVFRHYGLLPWKTVAANVAFGLQMAGAPRAYIQERVQHCLRLVGLEGFERSYPYQLSGGMQQRVGLARALAVNPAVLLMDEPFGSLDAQTRELMQEELLRIWRAQRTTLVFVTHSIDEALILGDRVVVMTNRPGRVREVVTVDIPRPRDPEVVRGMPRFVELRRHIWQQLRSEVGGRETQ